MGDFLHLARIPFQRGRNALRDTRRMHLARNIFLIVLGILILSAVFGLFRLVFGYFYRQPMIGPLLVSRIFSMAFLTFLFMLVYSNLMSSLSCHFLSNDLPMLMSTPVSPVAVFSAKALEAVAGSSWMVILMCIPLYAAFGAVKNPSWEFYPLAALAFCPFLLIPAAFSMSLNAALMYLFPARRMREIMLMFGTIMFAGAMVVFRLMDPERLVNPEESMQAVEFLRQLSVPSAPYLPSAWLARATLGAANAAFGWPSYLASSGLLWGTAAIVWCVALAIAAYFYRGAWQHASESLGVRRAVRLAGRWLPVRTGAYGAILRKDIKIFVRQPSQWGQVLLLAALVLIYLLNLSRLPDDLARGLRSLIFFLNLGFIGLILTAVAARFLFPQISLEGGAFALIRQAPLSMPRYLFARWAASSQPLLVLGLLLVAFSVPLLRVDAFMARIAYFSIASMTISISGLAIGCGAVFAKFRITNPEEIVTSMGGFFFMVLSLAFVMAVLLLEAQPVRLHYAVVFFGRSAASSLGLYAALAAVALLTAVSVYVPLKIGARVLAKTDL